MQALTGQSNEANVPGVSGENSTEPDGVGVRGEGRTGVQGQGGIGVQGQGAVVGVLGAILAPGNPVAVGVKGEGGPGIAVPGPGGVSIPVSIAIGVQGISSDTNGCGVEGINEAGIGIRGRGGRLAGSFQGDVEVTGDIRLTNADCAEDFDIADANPAEPGTVMILGEEGELHCSRQSYDKRVAGVISGAGDYKPGIVLDKKQSPSTRRRPIALVGKVYCKVDAQYACVEVGDLLTTSSTPGHAMKADDPVKAFGAVIGKALRPLHKGTGLIPILVALQ